MKRQFTTIFLSISISVFSNVCILGQNRDSIPRSPKDQPNVILTDKGVVDLEHAPTHDHDHDHDHNHDSVPQIKIYGWTISPRLGNRTIVDRDTSFINFHASTLVDGKDVAVGYLSNIGSPAQSKIFFNRPIDSNTGYIFLNAFNYWYKKPEDNIFLNTTVPYSNIYYQTAGGKEDGEQRLKVELSSNFGKKLNIGMNFDYLYARGLYSYQYNKHFIYDIYASYIGDRYKMHAYFNNNNINRSENGGLADSEDGRVKWYEFITKPDEVKKRIDFSGDSRNIPVNFMNTWNRLRGRRIYITNRYDLGNYKEQVWINDTTSVMRPKKNYIPLASLILTTNYTDQRRRVQSNFSNLDLYMKNNGLINQDLGNGSTPVQIKYDDPLNDFMSYYSLKNTFALAMNEGFRPWTKFGLTVFAEYDLRKYSVPNYTDSINNFYGNYKHYGDDKFTIGAEISKASGKYLFFDAKVSKDLISEDLSLEGNLTTKIYFKGKEMAVRANAYYKNIAPTLFEERFHSKYINWVKKLDAVQRSFIGGEIDIPFLRTRISGGVENITNHRYYGMDGIINQYGSSVQVLSFKLENKLQLGILNWENQIVYQSSSNQDIIPLPDLSVYTNLYIQTKISKVLGVQLGADAHYHTEYYAPGYNFMTMQFFNQKEYKIGNFPMANAYINLVLKNTRFFVMYYNFAQGMGNGNSFSLYRYAINPSGLKMGLTWKFNN